MNRVFADAFYFIAMLNPRDRAHSQAVTWSQNHVGQPVTTQFTLVEVADALSHPDARLGVLSLIRDLRDDAAVRVILSDPQLFDQGLERYHDRPDKHWSSSDCISFVVMESNGITEALT